MKRFAGVAGSFLCVLAVTGTAQAVTLTTPNGQLARPYQHWAARSHMPLPPGEVMVTDEPCPAPSTALACVRGDTIYAAGVLWFRRGFYHELGHVFSARVGNPTGLPEEQFAEAYSLCAYGVLVDGHPYGYGYNPTERQQGRVCRLIWARARDAGLTPF